MRHSYLCAQIPQTPGTYEYEIKYHSYFLYKSYSYTYDYVLKLKYNGRGNNGMNLPKWWEWTRA